MNEMKENSLRIETNFKLIDRPNECRFCHEFFIFLNNPKCRYHDGKKRFYNIPGKGKDDIKIDRGKGSIKKKGKDKEEISIKIDDCEALWDCCDQYYYKLKPGHSRSCNNDLMTIYQDNPKLFEDHSTGCKEHDYHEPMVNHPTKWNSNYEGNNN